jgi:outer membrane biosynthesis protein TonB
LFSPGEFPEPPTRCLALVLNDPRSIIVVVTVTEANDRTFTEKLVLRALIISLVIHFVAFFTYKIGQSQGWWTNWAMPRWMQAFTRVLTPAIPKKLAAATRDQVPLVFMETDPADAVPKAPPKTKFEGAHNTIAANAKIVKPSDIPNITGKQTKVLKTTANAKPKAPPAHPAVQPHQQTAAPVAPPQKTYIPGDLASMRPIPKPQPQTQETDNTSDSETPAQSQPRRPRTLSDANEHAGTLGETANLTGGVANMKLTGSSLDVKSSAVGNYEETMVDAIKQQWYQSLDNIPWNASGKVVVSFKLYPDGHVDKVNIAQNEVTDELATFCAEAIIKPSPFGAWPREMRLDIPADFLELQFTFYYDVE